jgi:hypothetical protein
MSTRGRGNILRFAADTMYAIVGLGLLSSVAGLKTFGRDRVVFFREAAAGDPARQSSPFALPTRSQRVCNVCVCVDHPC